MKMPGAPGMSQERNIMDTDRIGWLLVQLSLPAFMGMFVQTLYNVVNTIFIGHAVDKLGNPIGPLAIAGLSICFPVQMIFMGMGMMVGMGGTSIISRSIGAGETERAERTLGNGVACIMIISVVVTAVILPNINGFLRLIGASADVLPYAREYLVIIVSATFINLLGMTLLNFIRAEGNARVGMIANIAGAVINIILDAIFIIWMKMGVIGAALGTVIAQFAALIYMVSYYTSGSSYLKFRFRNLRLEGSILRPMFSLGISGFVQTVASSASAMFLLRQVVTYGGDIYLSAFGIIQRIMMFATMPAMVVGQGAQPILGFNYGARRFALALKTFRIAAVSSSVLSILAFSIVFGIPGPLIKIFNTDPALVSAGVNVSRLVFWSMPIMGLVMVGSSSFLSLGKAVQAFITASARPIIFLIPAVLIMPRLLGLNGVFLAFPVSDFFALVLTMVLLIPIFREFRRAASGQIAPQMAGKPFPPPGMGGMSPGAGITG
ncbi:MAG: MATE family efflux transporter [Dehalococcoidales bacterium]|nr:MATE family efflux transporter [Dehalococcoidales bacterium]